MKSYRLILALLLLGVAMTSFAQSTPEADSKPIIATPPSQPALTKFDLDFSGGTPAELITAIEKAQRKPLNSVIPSELTNQQLPALKMRGVNIQQLFLAFNQANESQKFRTTPTRNGDMVVQYGVEFGFRTLDKPVTDSSVWYFYGRGIQDPNSAKPEVSRFYQLSPYLKQGLNVDDITTAIQVGWRMAGVTQPPTLNFHKETSLLIAFGRTDHLETIEAVLHAITVEKPVTAQPAETPVAKP